MDSGVGVASELASDLLRIGAVRFSPENPFTWTSGLRSPVYCDNRLTIGHVDVRSRITDAFAHVINNEGLSAEVIAGTATAGIPHAAWLAQSLRLPMVYVRSKPKAHGTGSRVEGLIQEGARVLLIEDLVSTGGSSIDAVHALEAAGMPVAAVLAIFSYGLPSSERAFSEADIPLHTLTGIDALVDEAERSGRLEKRSIDAIRRWRRDPGAWSESYVSETPASDEG